MTPTGTSHYLYIGTHRPERLLHVLRFDPAAKTLEIVDSVDCGYNPTFLTLNRDRTFLYSVHQRTSETPGGAITAFAVARGSDGTPKLSKRGTSESGGEGPCHLFVDEKRGRIVVANYRSGSLGLISDNDMRLADQIEHTGSSADPKRQEGPHIHSVTPDPTGEYIVVCDLGIDRIVLYRWDNETKKIVKAQSVQTAPGAGPRHFAFHPSGKFGYVVNELDSTVVVYGYTPGSLKPMQTLSALPESFTGENTGADIHCTPDGSLLFASNRGHDSLARFRIDQNTGTLTEYGHISTHGSTPRNFAVGTGELDGLVFAANQESDSVVLLGHAGNEAFPDTPEAAVEVPKPVCIFID